MLLRVHGAHRMGHRRLVRPPQRMRRLSDQDPLFPGQPAMLPLPHPQPYAILITRLTTTQLPAGNRACRRRPIHWPWQGGQLLVPQRHGGLFR
ncbi:hypothetical protein BAE44_0018807 [Dichanthelium oligosanthes]|uniref:Uncharacterized protein n=1 Tax=Dichanthelium oligosanthes TaxID=888268 RepID=A0A1E5V4T3_9POAL|nr:hypothetical protein BAE44_0018807 [Dichanthelium oligosanthes]